MDLGDFLLVMSVSGVVISSYQWLRVVMGCFWGVFGWLFLKSRSHQTLFTTPVVPSLLQQVF